MTKPTLLSAQRVTMNQRLGLFLKWSALFTTLSLSVLAWISQNRANLPSPSSEDGNNLTRNYNILTHSIFITLLILSVGWMIHKIRQANAEEFTQNTTGKAQPSLFVHLSEGIKQHPLSIGLFALYTAYAVHQSSWFYKEIVAWYDDLLNGFLLNNFSLHSSFLKETMSSNDYRFFPLAHQDLHILSWLTPYIKIWAIVNCVELVATVVLIIKVVELITRRSSPPSMLAMAGILFIFIPASAYNYLQFIYSERILVLLLAAFFYNYLTYRESRRIQNRYGALICSLVGAFTKDTAILLFVIPPLCMMLWELIKQHRQESFPSIRKLWESCLDDYSLEIDLIALSIFFLLSFFYLSGIPSYYVGGARYDSELKFATLQLDPRLFFLGIYSALRLTRIVWRKANFTELDALNLGGLLYGFALYYLVGFKASNYMALPVQWIAVVDLLVIWTATTQRWRTNRKPSLRAIAGAGIGCSFAIIALEDGLPNNFYNRAKSIHETHKSWATTLAAVDTITEPARMNGQEVNLIFSKGWFKRKNHLKRLKYDRLIYIDADTKEITIQDGFNKGQHYVPKKGDFFLNIDSGGKLKKYDIDISNYKVIYDFDPSISNGKIYRHIGGQSDNTSAE